MRDFAGTDVFRVSGIAMPRRRMSTALLAATAAVALLALAPSAGAKKPVLVKRPSDPIVLTGNQVPRLLGMAPGDLVAYRYQHGKKCKASGCGLGKLVRVPVQVDERAQVDFGSQPPSNSTPPSGATVYGTAPIGVTALQYTDPKTFVGPDPNPTIDGDDEIALMAFDADERAPKRVGRPKQALGGRATTVAVSDPLTHARSFIYLFKKVPNLKPLGTDYVDYSFKLNSGDYKATYRRATGPNPESSTVTTADYRASYSDRWFLDGLAIDAGNAGGQEILDGYKTGFAPGSCGRSEATYNAAEGAFVANIDGPVRAIRSYVGANSGPLTERTDVFYRSRQEVRIDLRVHPVPSILAMIDLNAAAFGMTYRNSANPGGVTVDGAPDPISSAQAAWHLWSGSQGSLFSTTNLAVSFPAQVAAGSVSSLYGDQLNTPTMQCWGDDDLIGMAGTYLIPSGGIPNTDPRSAPAATLHADSVQLLGAPGQTAADAGTNFGRVGHPLAATAGKFKSKRPRKKR